MDEYPKMLLRPGGDGVAFGYPCTSVIVGNEDEELAADGFMSAADFLSAADPLDRDGDGAKGGSRPRKVKPDE